MTDLTKITTPFGLLDEETQIALKAHTGPIELFDGLASWVIPASKSFAPQYTYRAKAQPEEIWVIDSTTHPSLEDAKEAADRNDLRGPIKHFREVL